MQPLFLVSWMLSPGYLLAGRYSGGVNSQSPAPTSRLERILAAMVVGIVGLSIIAFFAVIFGTFAGLQREDFGEGLWPVATMLPLIGLPLGFVLVMALLVVSTRRRRQGGTGAQSG